MTALTVIAADETDVVPGVDLDKLGVVGGWLLSIPAVRDWREGQRRTRFRIFYVVRDDQEVPPHWPDGDSFPTLTVPVTDRILRRYEDVARGARP